MSQEAKIQKDQQQKSAITTEEPLRSALAKLQLQLEEIKALREK